MKRLKKTLTWIAVVACVLVGIHIVLNLVFGAQLRSVLRDLKARGHPVTLGEIKPAAVPPEENAAVLYVQAFAQMTAGQGVKIYPEATALQGSFQVLKDLWTSTNEFRWTSGEVARARAALATPEVQRVTAILEEAARKPRCNFDLDYAKGPGLQMPHLGVFRTCARVLAARAWFQAESGDAKGALETLSVVLRMADHLGAEPILIPQLVGSACDDIAIPCLQRIASRADLPAEETGSLMRALKGRAKNESMSRALEAERVMFGGWFLDRFTGRDSDLVAEALGLKSGWEVRWGVPLAGPILKKDMAFYMRIMGEMADVARLPCPQVAERLRQGFAPESSIPWYAFITRRAVPSLTAILARNLGHAATVESARVALAATLYRQKHGQYPSKLEDLAGEFLKELPLDPFTGKSLLYSCAEGRLKVYSPGFDGKDDGGKPRASGADWNSAGYDVGWFENP